MSTSKLYIPEKIKVGFQERGGTYTGKLAYVIYYDHKGTLRKEKSWQSWRDHKIATLDSANEPTEGFVLNKGVGGQRQSYGWNARNEYIRVYDPRDFEFEISVANLLFILKECDCSRGKGLEGKFVYAWDGTEIVLLPTSSQDYLNSQKHTQLQQTKISAKDLIPGATYLTKQQEPLIYLGYFERHKPYALDSRNYDNTVTNMSAACKKTHVFYNEKSDWHGNHFEFPSGMSKLGACQSETPVPNFAELVKSYYESIYGSKVVKLTLKDVQGTMYKDKYGYEESRYLAFEDGGGFIQYTASSKTNYYITTTDRITLEDNGVLNFTTHNAVSYPSSYQKPSYYNYGYYGRDRQSEIPWKDHKPMTLWATLESGSEFKIGYRSLILPKKK